MSTNIATQSETKIKNDFYKYLPYNYIGYGKINYTSGRLENELVQNCTCKHRCHMGIIMIPLINLISNQGRYKQN